jgi:hypothetical protein
MPEESNAFTAKIKLKRKRLPSSPINVRISASPEEVSQGGASGSPNPSAAQEAAFKFPSSPRAKTPKGVRTPSGKKGSYK